MSAAVQPAAPLIKSIQTISIGVGTLTSATATITAVNTAKTIIQWNGKRAGENGPFSTIGGGPAQLEVSLTLTNSTTVTANIDFLWGSTIATVRAQIIEYY